MDRLLRRAPIITLLLYAALTIFYTRPLLLHLTSAIAGGNGEGWRNYWSYWWTPFALINAHQSPLHTNWLFYQSGTSLYPYPLQPLNGLISAPFQLVSPTFATNLITLLSYLLTAWFTYLLARVLLQNYASVEASGLPPAPTIEANAGELGGLPPAPTIEANTGELGGLPPAPTNANPNSSLITNHPSLLIEAAAFLAGFAFAFANPWRLQYLNGGQDGLLSSEWLPLFLYFAYRVYFRAGWRNTLFATLCLIAAALTDWQYLVYIVFFILILLIVELIARGGRAWLPLAARVGGAVVVGLVLLSPLLVSTLGELSANPALVPSGGATILHSADLLDLLAPNHTNPLWGGLADQLNLSVHGTYPVAGAFSPPYVVIALALAGLIFTRRWLPTRGLLVNLASFLLLSLGPLLHINGVEAYSDFRGNILMPAAFLYYLPFMSLAPYPERFGEVAFLCWSLLASLGCFTLAQRYVAARPFSPPPPLREESSILHRARVRVLRAWWPLAVGFTLVLLLAGVEFVKVTPPITPVSTPPFYQQLGKDNARYAIMELPIYKGSDESRWVSYQAVHHKYLFGGDLGGQSYPFAQYTPVLNWFWAQQLPGPDIVPAPPTSVALNVLRWSNVRDVVLIKQPVASQQLAAAQALIAAVWGANARPIYSDEIMDVYAVPTSAVTSTTTLTPLLAVGDGWNDFEADPYGGHRAINGTGGNRAASIAILGLGASGSYTLTFRAFSYDQPHQVAMQYLGRTVTTLTITPNPQTLSLPLTVATNRYPLTFQILDPPPDSGSDSHPRSIAFGNFSLSR